MGLVSEFKDFINRGNVMDLAVGVIIGGAFGKIVSSLVDDLLMPVISMATGKTDFKNMFIPLAQQTAHDLDAAKKEGAVVAYGSFINSCVTFLIVAFAVFMLVKAVKAMEKPAPAEAAAPAAPTEVELLTEIRDALRKA